MSYKYGKRKISTKHGFRLKSEVDVNAWFSRQTKTDTDIDVNVCMYLYVHMSIFPSSANREDLEEVTSPKHKHT